VSGEDLVEHMLWIGAGKPLPERLTKNPTLGFNGHAIESRVYAEDPKRKFLPSIGPLITYKEPDTYATEGEAYIASFFSSSFSFLFLFIALHPASSHFLDGTVRIDTGVFEGGLISMFYDPMIAKLCTHASTRKEAIRLQEQALDQYVVQGLANNIPFLRSIYRNKK
jgi:acetyl/propionyl-CoA carboxylase alpha subunit